MQCHSASERVRVRVACAGFAGRGMGAVDASRWSEAFRTLWRDLDVGLGWVMSSGDYSRTTSRDA